MDENLWLNKTGSLIDNNQISLKNITERSRWLSTFYLGYMSERERESIMVVVNIYNENECHSITNLFCRKHGRP